MNETLDGADELFGDIDAPGGFSDRRPATPPQRAQGAAHGDNAAAMMMPLWDNVIDADYQFGAIPQLDLGEGDSQTSELDLDGYNAEEHRALP